MRKSFVLKGRATRSEFWWFLLISVVINFLCYGILLANNEEFNATIALPVTILLLLALVLLPASISVCVRRLHDSGHSGWNFFWSFFPFVGCLVLLYLVCLGSAPDNEYGPNPFKETEGTV
ncbi:MAG: DUF805 domain-containing protein [Phocaeicola sp.]|uniref:DUF805 domain-containing protein n=1 Tax=Phocaeicola TaxID=909656 RepID=UPI00234F8353|nr:DUF805 domain-containing protein [Phocaeicola oris]MCE2615422.1 DUF805 domain-containing protein [Phocaeicola oris]